jgi:hypothetical protein
MFRGTGAYASALTAVLAVLAVGAATASAGDHGPWATAVDAESVPGTSSELNTGVQDGCPIQAPDGLSLYMASTRPRFPGDPRTDIDIWVAHRESKDAPWGAPENLGAPVNSTADDFCPTPTRGGRLFFVSRKVVPGVTCGAGDIYLTRLNPGQGWAEPKHLGCSPDGPNTALDEQGPSYVKAGGPTLYFSSGPEVQRSERHGDGSFGAPEPVAELNSPVADVQPNIRRDGREVVFASTRPRFLGDTRTDFDIWVATRESVNGPWSAPVNLVAVNTSASETRPSLSWDATTLYLGRAPGGPPTTDIYFSTRERNGG